MEKFFVHIAKNRDKIIKIRQIIHEVNAMDKDLFSKWQENVQVDADGNTKLHVAALSQSSEVIKELCKACDCYALNKQGITPIIMAICVGNYSAFEAFQSVSPHLIRKGAHGFSAIGWNDIAETDRSIVGTAKDDTLFEDLLAARMHYNAMILESNRQNKNT
jgi:ankyrin repeat protein